MAHSLCRWAVISLVCCLTLAASGDDVCIVRIALPSLFVGEPPSSLDDPNTDFVISSKGGDHFTPAAHQPVDFASVELLFALTPDSSPLHMVFDAEPYPGTVRLAIPLRC